MDNDLDVIEEFLGDMFMPAFATSVLDKQLRDMGENRKTYTREILDRLLKQLETKVLISFKGDDAPLLTRTLRKRIISSGGLA